MSSHAIMMMMMTTMVMMITHNSSSILSLIDHCPIHTLRGNWNGRTKSMVEYSGELISNICQRMCCESFKRGG